MDGLYDKLGEYENLDELNYLASKLDEMDQSDYAKFQAAMEIGDYTSSLQEIINLTENLDCYEIYPNIEDYDDLGRYYIEELEVTQVPAHLQNYIDYEAYGRDVALEENGTFTDQGYVWDTREAFHEYYDGERGSIPEEYRVMTFQDDLPEEEKSEWAMDIAFDMDEFFRQNDPQYAAEHPEAHAAKEELYESLMAGRISALDEKLAALGQTQEDYLPSEIEKFKDATGYEEFLDFDPAEVKTVLENPDKSRIDEMLAFAEKAEREYMAEAAGYVQTPADIAEQAQAVPRDTFSIYQLKPGDTTRDYRFEPLDAIRNNGLSVKPENYELVYTAPLTEQDSLESIYTRFNIDHPADFKGHSLSVSDIVVLHQDGKDTAHYCDRFGFSQVPEFLQPERAAEVTIPTPDQMATQERISTPRGSFCVTNMTREQMEAAGYGVHHQSDDGKYLIMGNGSRSFAIRNEETQEHAAPEKMTVLVVEPMKEPYVKEIAPGLHSLQAEVGGDIAATYPFSDPVGLVCNDEGKLIGLELNRGLRDEHGEIYDIMAGTFLVVGLSEDSFTSLTPEQVQKYTEHFKQPEQFISLNGQIVALPVEPENPLRTAEMTLEDDYGMIDGVLNNGRRGEELEKAQGEVRRTTPEKKPSIRERLAEAKKECSERKPPDKAHQKKPPEHDL